MKKTLLILMALLLSLSVAGAALAGGANPPKALALKWDPWNEVDLLTIKMNAPLKTADGKVKFYTIAGNHLWLSDPAEMSIPIAGAGHVIPGTTTFHFSYSGSYKSGSSFYGLMCEGDYDLFLGTGTLTFQYLNFGVIGNPINTGNRQTIGITANPTDTYVAPQDLIQGIGHSYQAK
jgi:hypothetical protein